MMEMDYSQPVLNGTGDTDYARYMRTDELLALQRLGDSLLARSCHPGYLPCGVQPPATSGADRMKWVTGRRRHG
ncbi:MAG: hypothetical protein OXI66_10745, partial [Boseongicola sp.]|nr:hypothetical protein [Boseongicola sp.]